MYRHLLRAAALLLATSAFAQDGTPGSGPEPAYRDLWCGLAFTEAAGDAGGEITELQQAVIPRYTEGAARLLTRAEAAYGEAGLSGERFKAHSDIVAAGIAAAIASDSEPFSFEECAALLAP
jgi:hypothetical protein